MICKIAHSYFYYKWIVLQGDNVEKWYVKLLTVTSIAAIKCILPLIFASPSYNIDIQEKFVFGVFKKLSLKQSCSNWMVLIGLPFII